MASPAQIGLIHGLKKRAALDEDVYRDVLRQTAGVASARDLSGPAAGRVIDRLKVLAGDDPARDRPAKPTAAGALALEGPFVGKLRALWLTGWNLGIVADRSDRALASFVGRQTGLDSPSWVRDPRDAARAIEGLKAWIAREGGLAWPENPRDVDEIKRRLVRRQWARLIELGCEVWHSPESDLASYATEIRRTSGLVPGDRGAVVAGLGNMTPEELDHLAAALGRKLRAKIAATKTTETGRAPR